MFWRLAFAAAVAAAVVAEVAEALRAEEAVVAEPALPLEAAPAGQLLVRRRGQVRAALLQ